MKILSNRKYRELQSEIRASRDTYNEDITSLMLDNKDYELKIDEIRKRLYAVMGLKKNIRQVSKNTIFKHVEAVIRFIEKGK